MKRSTIARLGAASLLTLAGCGRTHAGPAGADAPRAPYAGSPRSSSRPPSSSREPHHTPKTYRVSLQATVNPFPNGGSARGTTLKVVLSDESERAIHVSTVRSESPFLCTIVARDERTLTTACGEAAIRIRTIGGWLEVTDEAGGFSAWPIAEGDRVQFPATIDTTPIACSEAESFLDVYFEFIPKKGYAVRIPKYEVTEFLAPPDRCDAAGICTGAFCSGAAMNHVGRAAVACSLVESKSTYAFVANADSISWATSAAEIDVPTTSAPIGILPLPCGMKARFHVRPHVSPHFRTLGGRRDTEYEVRYTLCRDLCRARFAASNGELDDDDPAAHACTKRCPPPFAPSR